MHPKQLNLLFLYFCVVILLQACEQGKMAQHEPTNTYLNTLPATAKINSLRYNQKKEDLSRCLDVDLAYRLEFELEMIEKEWETQIAFEKKNLSFPVYLPFQISNEAEIRVEEIFIDTCRINKNSIGLKFLANNSFTFSKEDILRKNLYYFAQDKKGKTISKTCTASVSNPFYREVTGGNISFTGFLEPLENLNDFNKIIIISKNQYITMTQK